MTIWKYFAAPAASPLFMAMRPSASGGLPHVGSTSAARSYAVHRLVCLRRADFTSPRS